MYSLHRELPRQRLHQRVGPQLVPGEELVVGAHVCCNGEDDDPTRSVSAARAAEERKERLAEGG